MMDRSLVIGVLLLLVVMAVAPLGASGQPALSGVAAQPEADNTITRIQLAENGSARWTIQVRTRLESDEAVSEFEQFQDRIRANESIVLDSFRDRMTNVVKTAANTTGRPMSARNFAVSTRIQEVPQRWGIVEYAFVWTAFGAERDGTLRVGDVFEGGFFLSEEDRLVIAPPPGYRIANSTPQPDSVPDGAVAWTGRQDFADTRPAVVIEPVPATPAGEASSPTTEQIDDGTTAGDQLMPAPVWLWPVLLVVLAAVLLVLLRRRRGDGMVGGDPAAESRTDAGSAGGGVATNEERVRSLLESRGGELRQAAIAEELDWSESKTSRVLSAMAEAGEIEQLRIGRENVIRLPDAADR